MLDPVIAADGYTYERKFIQQWVKTSNKSPVSGAILSKQIFIPNYNLRRQISAQGDKLRYMTLNYFDILPIEVIIMIFEYLNIGHLVIVSYVCRLFREVAASEYLFKNLVLKQYSNQIKKK